MSAVQSLQHFSNAVQAALNRAAWLAEGQSDALQFARQVAGELWLLEAKIQEVAAWLAKQAAAMNEAQSAERKASLYHAGFLTELREALAVIQQSAQAADNGQQTLPLSLRCKTWTAQGTKDALYFAVSGVDLFQLNVEIRETNELLLNPPAVLQAAMSPYKSTRLYKEGYLAGLELALQLITTTAESGSQHDAISAIASPALSPSP